MSSTLAIFIVTFTAIVVGSCLLALVVYSFGFLFGAGMKRAGILGEGPPGPRGNTGFPGPPGPSGEDAAITIRSEGGGFPEFDWLQKVGKDAARRRYEGTVGVTGHDGVPGEDGKDGFPR